MIRRTSLCTPFSYLYFKVPNDDRVIFDFGSKLVKVGLCNEARPRWIGRYFEPMRDSRGLVVQLNVRLLIMRFYICIGMLSMGY
jgi:hypothetical protein